MDILKRYAIPFKGLPQGRHDFRFCVDDNFFSAFESKDITGGDADVEVELTKSSNMLSLRVRITGIATVPCDRCLEDCRLPIDFDGGFKVKFGDADGDFDGEIMWLGHAENELNLARYIYESIALGLPYQRVHPDDENGNPTCNPDMLSRFRIISQDEFDRLTGSEQQKMGDNPEWEKLREIKKEL